MHQRDCSIQDRREMKPNSPGLDRSEGRDREARRVTLTEVPTKGSKRPAEMRFLLITPTSRADKASKALYVVTNYFPHTSPSQPSWLPSLSDFQILKLLLPKDLQAPEHTSSSLVSLPLHNLFRLLGMSPGKASAQQNVLFPSLQVTAGSSWSLLRLTLTGPSLVLPVYVTPTHVQWPGYLFFARLEALWGERPTLWSLNSQDLEQHLAHRVTSNKYVMVEWIYTGPSFFCLFSIPFSLLMETTAWFSPWGLTTSSPARTGATRSNVNLEQRVTEIKTGGA